MAKEADHTEYQQILEADKHADKKSLRRQRDVRKILDVRRLRRACVLIFTYLLLGELLPYPTNNVGLFASWKWQQLILLILLSTLVVSLCCLPEGKPEEGDSGTHDGGTHDGGTLHGGTPTTLFGATTLLVALNVVPLAVATLTTGFVRASDNCPAVPGGTCDSLALVLDASGLVAARLSRLDLGLTFLLSARGDSSWILGATGGRLGYAKAMPLHRAAGWWCACMSALHGLSYVMFYLYTGGMRTFLLRCFPVSYADEQEAWLYNNYNGENNNATRSITAAINERNFVVHSLSYNREGLINFFGLIGLLSVIVLTVPAWSRKWCYHIFQQMHVPAVRFSLRIPMNEQQQHRCRVFLFSLWSLTLFLFFFFFFFSFC